MRFRFEQLERRDLMVATFDIDGPTFVSAGEVVEYTVEVDVSDFALVTALQLPLEEVAWRLDGAPIASGENFQAIELADSGTLTATGRVPDNLSHFVLYVSAREGSSSRIAGRLAFVVDDIVDSETLGVEVSWHNTDGRGVLTLENSCSFHSLKNIGDTNGDGIIDLLYKHCFPEDGVRLVEHTLIGPGLESANRTIIAPPEPLDFVDLGIESGEYPIGDVDGDGFDDLLRTEPRKFEGIGLATIFFGPNYRENFSIIGTDNVNQIDNFIAYGGYAESLGDINGDGRGDFYVASAAAHTFRIHVLHGRDFGRDAPMPGLPGDIDRDGTVAFSDFIILSANFGRSNVAPDEGDVDGDGRVSFTDFLILSSNFGRTA